jgi:hypothetical protein
MKSYLKTEDKAQDEAEDEGRIDFFLIRERV